MKVKIISIEDNSTVYYTLDGEKKPNIYHMDVNQKMMEAANEMCIQKLVLESDNLLRNTIMGFHKYLGVAMKILDVFKLAKDPNLAPYVDFVYEKQKRAPVVQDETYAHSVKFSRN